MFVVMLKFAANKAQASQFMEGHKKWIKRGFDDGVFLLIDLQSRVNADPFVAQNVVSAEIVEIAPSRADERLKFLLG